MTFMLPMPLHLVHSQLMTFMLPMLLYVAHSQLMTFMLPTPLHLVHSQLMTFMVPTLLYVAHSQFTAARKTQHVACNAHPSFKSSWQSGIAGRRPLPAARSRVWAAGPRCVQHTPHVLHNMPPNKRLVLLPRAAPLFPVRTARAPSDEWDAPV